MDEFEKREYEAWQDSLGDNYPYKVYRRPDPRDEDIHGATRQLVEASAEPRLRDPTRDDDGRYHVFDYEHVDNDPATFRLALKVFDGYAAPDSATKDGDLVMLWGLHRRGGRMAYRLRTIRGAQFDRYSLRGTYAPGHTLHGTPRIPLLPVSLLNAALSMTPLLSYDSRRQLMALVAHGKTGSHIYADDLDGLYMDMSERSLFYEQGLEQVTEVYPNNIALRELSNRMALLREDPTEEDSNE